MLAEYAPILVFVIIGLLFGCVMLFAGYFASPSKPDSEKEKPFECGFDAFETSRTKFDVRFYLVAILFIIFDLEIAFLFPWAVVFDDIGWFGVISMAIFLLLLLIGFLYEWKKGALEWE